MQIDALYYQDQYLKEFTANVLSCEMIDDIYAVILSNTAFYPEGGGQSSDIGYLGDSEVINVKEKDNQIIHYVKDEVEVNKEVKCYINWDKRFDNMQNHTAEHIVSGLIHKLFGYDNVGFHMGEVIQVDFNGPLTKENIKKVEDEANKVIYKNIDVEELWPNNNELESLDYRSKLDLKDNVRIIKIDDIDMCACCGTHVKKTGEIGIIKIISISKHKDGVRLEMLAGNRCFNYLRNIFDENHEISVLLSAPLDDTFSYVNRLKDDISKKNEEKNYYSELYLSNKNYSVLDDGIVFEIEDNIDKNILRKHANNLLAKDNINTVVIINKTINNNEYIIMSKNINLKEAIKEINMKLNGKGGGSTDIVQGSFMSEIDDIKRVIVDIFRSGKYLV